MVRKSIILPYEAAVLNPNETITVPLGFEANCTEDEIVGDLVVFSLTVDYTVERLTSNSYDSRLVVGIINEKPTPTTAIVIVLGIVTGLASGLDRGRAVFVGTDGKPTTTVPTTGDRQIVGMALSATDFVVRVDVNKIILT